MQYYTTALVSNTQQHWSVIHNSTGQ